MTIEWNNLLRSVIPTGVLGTAAFTLCSQPALAFFPPVPTGNERPTVVVPPVSPPPILVPPVIPPVPPPPFVPPAPPPIVVPPSPPGPVIRPAVVPEPATIISAGLGLAILVGARRKRVKNV